MVRELSQSGLNDICPSQEEALCAHLNLEVLEGFGDAAVTILLNKNVSFDLCYFVWNNINIFNILIFTQTYLHIMSIRLFCICLTYWQWSEYLIAYDSQENMIEVVSAPAQQVHALLITFLLQFMHGIFITEGYKRETITSAVQRHSSLSFDDCLLDPFYTEKHAEHIKQG